MCWPPIGWLFVRGKSQIAMVVGRVCWVVVGEGSFIQRRQSIGDKTVVKKRVVVHVEFYCTSIHRRDTYTVVAVDKDAAGVFAPRFANIPVDAAVVVPAVLPTADVVFGVPKPAVVTPRQNQRKYESLSSMAY